MLHLITGTPGAKKTAFTVFKLDKIETQNKANLVKNKAIYAYNKNLIEKHNLQDDFSTYAYDVGSGHLLKRQIIALDDDYFDIFEQDFDDLRPDDYFQRVVRFNEIAENLKELDNIPFKALLPVRTIYTNINGLKIDYVRALPYDWRETPDGSIHVVDEVQLVEPYSDLKDKKNDIVQELTIHRHRGFDFYFITQAPSLLHPTIKELIGVHWHLTVPYGLSTRVYQFGSCRPYPNTVSNKMNAETKFGFNPPARIFKLYKSTTINTHQKRIPWKQVIIFGILIAVCLTAIFGGHSKGKDSMMLNGGHSKTQDNLLSSTAVTSATSVTVVTSAPSATAFTPPPAVVLPIPSYQQKMQSMPANFISFGTKCTAYNLDGLPIDMPISDCKQYASGVKKLAIQMVSTRQDFTPAPTVVPAPASAVVSIPIASSAPAITVSEQSGAEYVFNADKSHERLFN